MSVRRIKNHGKWVWRARVAFQGLRHAPFRPSREEARQTRGRAAPRPEGAGGQADCHRRRCTSSLSTMTLDMHARAKGEESVGRVIEDLMPDDPLDRGEQSTRRRP